MAAFCTTCCGSSRPRHETALNIPPRLVTTLRAADRITVLTGSGVSAESGVPTFRDAQTGLWERFRPEELATPEAFERDPKLVWEWYEWRRELVAKAEPNPAHRALAELESIVENFQLVTQNVDGLHQRAGSKNVLEFHGNITRNKCARENTLINGWEDKSTVPPTCPSCGGPVRPDVVWFGEIIAPAVLERAIAAAEVCDVFFSIGTSALVHPAAGLAEVALRRGACCVEINPNPTPLTRSVDYSLQYPAGEALPELVAALGAS